MCITIDIPCIMRTMLMHNVKTRGPYGPRSSPEFTAITSCKIYGQMTIRSNGLDEMPYARAIMKKVIGNYTVQQN